VVTSSPQRSDRLAHATVGKLRSTPSGLGRQLAADLETEILGTDRGTSWEQNAPEQGRKPCNKVHVNQ
jgi:hypothetical protein